MATHNQVRIKGYILNEVKIIGDTENQTEKAFINVRTTHRDIDNFKGERFEDILVYYDGSDERMMEKIKKLNPFDIIDIKGVFNILTMNKRSHCPSCGEANVKYNGSATFIYPIDIEKCNALMTAYEHDEELPEKLLVKHYKETSNQALIIGTVVNDPKLKQYKNTACCQYMLGVNRKYYIKTQGEITADYPWVYTFGQQAEDDARHLIKGSVILVDGFIRTRKVGVPMVCENCGAEYEYPDLATEFIPYSVEYLNNYLTDEDIAKIEEEQRQTEYENAKKEIWG